MCVLAFLFLKIFKILLFFASICAKRLALTMLLAGDFKLEVFPPLLGDLLLFDDDDDFDRLLLGDFPLLFA
jgi:hypothetical protein